MGFLYRWRYGAMGVSVGYFTSGLLAPIALAITFLVLDGVTEYHHERRLNRARNTWMWALIKSELRRR